DLLDRGHGHAAPSAAVRPRHGRVRHGARRRAPRGQLVDALLGPVERPDTTYEQREPPSPSGRSCERLVASRRRRFPPPFLDAPLTTPWIAARSAPISAPEVAAKSTAARVRRVNEALAAAPGLLARSEPDDPRAAPPGDRRSAAPRRDR